METEDIIDRDEYYAERFQYEAECERYDGADDDDYDEFEENGYASEEDYWLERI